MIYDLYYNNDPDDITVHYRVYRSSHDEQLCVVCVQNFDYPDYIEERFVETVSYLYEAEAERRVLILSNPDKFIPELSETHYRIYRPSDDAEPVVVTIESDYDYQDYDEDRFENDGYYADYDEADLAIFYL